MNRKDAPDTHQLANCPGSEIARSDVAHSLDNITDDILVGDGSAPTVEPRGSSTTSKPSMQTIRAATEAQVVQSSSERMSMRDMALNKLAVPEFRQRNGFEETLIAVFGLFALVSPLLLWVSWTQAMFEIVFALSVVSIAVCYGVVHFSKGD